MGFVVRFNKGNKVFEGKKVFKSRAVAEKKVRLIRQIDDDLPRKDRDKSLKTYRVVKAPKRIKLRKRK